MYYFIQLILKRERRKNEKVFDRGNVDVVVVVIVGVW